MCRPTLLTYLYSKSDSSGGQHMKAMVYEKYGPPDVLRWTDVTQPTPKENELLIRIHATTVTSADMRARSLQLPTGFGFMGRLVFGVSRPRQPILGTELAGEVAAIGKHVTRFKVGDRVFAYPGGSMGSYAEYRCMPENGAVALMPPSLTYSQAAALSFGGLTALSFLKLGRLQRGERVLVNGASGGVGTAAVQLAKHFGAEVTGVCSTPNVALVTSLGADHVIDYTRDDFTKHGPYDIVVDTVGTAPYSRCKVALKDGGRLLLVLAGLSDTLAAPWVSMMSRHKVIAGVASGRAEDLRLLAGLVDEGTYKPVIDRCYPMAEMVEAHRYVETGRKRGNVIVTLA
jgi:NADPH:quinone reductase-like Zn-dependent oxidoreductase